MIVVVALFPTLFTPVDPPNCELLPRAQQRRPGGGHPLGFTKQGCDVYSRIIYGTSTSLSVGLIVIVLITVLGVVVRCLRRLLRRLGRLVLSRVGDIFFSIPYILAAVVIMSVLLGVPERLDHLAGDRRLRLAVDGARPAGRDPAGEATPTS